MFKVLKIRTKLLYIQWFSPYLTVSNCVLPLERQTGE